MPKLNLPDDSPQDLPIAARRIYAGRHTGAWKVAYADFATALMALFIVLWTMNASKTVRKSVEGYFRDPRGFTQKQGAGPANSGEGVVINRDNMSELRQRMEDALHSMPEFPKIAENVKFSATGEGLRIDLLETEQGMFFVTGSPGPTPAGERLLQVLAAELVKIPNRIVVEGHTDARPFRNATPTAGYGNWELGTDRANAARRLLHQYGLATGKVAEVRGFADERPFNAEDRDDPRNRRVSVVIRFPGAPS
jgi:chemotaxis protein MotB